MFCLNFKPTLAAHSGIPAVAAENYLFALVHDVPVIVEACVYRRFRTALADGFNFGNRFGDFKQTPASREEMSRKIGCQTETQYGNGKFYNDIAELIDLLWCQKLTFVYYSRTKTNLNYI